MADFYCHEAALVVEVDGSHHRDERLRCDARRDSFMGLQGLRVVRVPAGVAHQELDAVLRMIRGALEEALGREVVAQRVSERNRVKTAAVTRAIRDVRSSSD